MISRLRLCSLLLLSAFSFQFSAFSDPSFNLKADRSGSVLLPDPNGPPYANYPTGLLMVNGVPVVGGGGGGGGGSVSSVGLFSNAPWLTVGASPVTTSGTLTLNLTSGLMANKVLATPDGATGAVNLRALVANDIPALPESKITSLTTDLASADRLTTGTVLGTLIQRQMSITADGSGLKLSGDTASPGANKVYGTDGSGVKGWQTAGTGSGSITSVTGDNGSNVGLTLSVANGSGPTTGLQLGGTLNWTSINRTGALPQDIGAQGASLQLNGSGSATVTWTSGKYFLKQNAALTQSVAGTLPPTSAYADGQEIVYTDRLTSATAPYGVGWSPGAGDTVNGSNGPLTAFIGGGTVRFRKNGTDWEQTDTHFSISTVQDFTDPSKQMTFDLSAVPSSTTLTVHALNGAISDLLGTSSVRGKAKTLCLAVRTDAKTGTGTEEDPFDASGTKYDTRLAALAAAHTQNLDIHLIGTGFQTDAATGGLGTAFYVQNGWHIHGDGMYVTTVTMIGSMAGEHYDHEAFKAPATTPADNVTISDLTIDANYATLSATADTVNSEKYYVAYGVGISGSHNTLDRVRLINQYGTFANGGECFGLALGSATAGSVGATIRNCVVELPHGTYAGAPFACGGIDTTHLMSDWSVHDNWVFGTNDGVSTATFNTGGVNIAFAERGEIYNNHFVDCRGIVYSDTGNVKTLRVHNNRAVRAWQGVGLISDEVAQPTWTKTDISCTDNVISIQDRTGGEFSAFRFMGGSGISVTGTNVVTKLSGGVGTGGAWTVLADNSVDTITVNDLIGPNENASIVGTNVTKNRNRTPVGGLITGLEDSSVSSTVAALTLNPASGDTPIFFQLNSVAKWQLSSQGTNSDLFRLFNYGTSTDALEFNFSTNAAHFTGSILSDSTLQGTKLGLGAAADKLLTIQRAGTTANTEIAIKDQLGANVASIGIEAASTNDLLIASNAGTRWYTGSTIGASGVPTNERMRLSSAGGLSIGSTTDAGAGAGNLLLSGLTASNYVKTNSSKVLVSASTIPGTDLSLTDVTTNNASTSNHGFLPKLDNTSTHFLNGQGGWTTPNGSDNLGLTPTAVKSSNYSAAAGDLVPCDTTSAGFTVTLPTAPADKSVVAIKHVIQGGTNTVSLATGGSDVFNKTGGGTSGTLTLVNQGLLLQYKASGAIWYAIADDIPLSGMDARYATAAQGTLAASAVQPSTAPTLAGTNFTGIPIASTTGYGTGIATWLATPTEANFKSAQSGLGWLDTAGTWTAAQINSTAGAASTAAMKYSGVPFAGTGTTSFPLVYLNDSNATASTTLATAGTYLGVNGHGTADLMNLMLDGVSKFKITSTGGFTAANASSASAFTVTSAATWNSANLRLGSAQYFGFSSATDGTGTISDTTFSRVSAGKMAVGTGTTTTNGILQLNNTQLNALTVSTLPTGVAGMQAYVTDGDSALAWGATVVNSGAGATKYLVWYNGTNWTVMGK